ncbi:hypothetical protein ACQEU6_46260 [Spirillospora sp. CA-108201]
MGRKDTELDVVAAVQAQTAQAAALAAIEGQARLADPRLNPATRGHADVLRGEQLTRALDAEHARLLRRHRVADRRAAEAEETLAAIALARHAASPARSVRALHAGRKVYARLSLAASVVLAAGSAMGVEAAAGVLHAPGGTGYVAEVGLTGLATAAISYRAHLAEHRGELGDGWQKRTLWALMTVPLLISIAANLGTKNALGAACALGAAAFSVLACVVADRSAAAMQKRVKEVSDEAEDTIRATAMGEDLFSLTTDALDTDDLAPAGTRRIEARPDDAAAVERRPDERDRPRTRTREDASDDAADEAPADEGLDDVDHQEPGETDPVADAARTGVDELSAWLASQEPPEEGAAPPAAPVSDGGPSGAARDLPEHEPDDGPDDSRDDSLDGGGRIDGGAISREGGQIDPDRSGRTERAAEARRAAGAATRGRIADYLDDHPSATNPRIAHALGLDVSTVKRHRRALRALRRRPLDGGGR